MKIEIALGVPLIFVDTPFKGSLTRGLVAPLSRELPVVEMYSPGAKFTIARIISNVKVDQWSPAYWTGAKINVYRADDMLTVFTHVFKDSEGFPIKVYEQYNMIEPMSFINEKMVAVWTSELGDVASNVDMRGFDVMGYTFTIPMDVDEEIFTIEFIPMINGKELYEQGVISQHIRCFKGVVGARKTDQTVHGVFKRLGEGLDILTPAIPDSLQRKLYLTHDIIIDMNQQGPFVKGSWAYDKKRWMRLSFYQFKPLGKVLTRRLHGLNIYLIDTISQDEFKLKTIKDNDIKPVDISREHITDGHGRIMDKSMAMSLDNAKPPKWAQLHSVDGLDIASATFIVPHNQHGGVLNFNFQKQAGELLYYTLWIDFTAFQRTGRFQFKFENYFGDNRVNRVSYSEDFWIDSEVNVIALKAGNVVDEFNREIPKTLSWKATRSRLNSRNSVPSSVPSRAESVVSEDISMSTTTQVMDKLRRISIPKVTIDSSIKRATAAGEKSLTVIKEDEDEEKQEIAGDAYEFESDEDDEEEEEYDEELFKKLKNASPTVKFHLEDNRPKEKLLYIPFKKRFDFIPRAPQDFTREKPIDYYISDGVRYEVARTLEWDEMYGKLMEMELDSGKILGDIFRLRGCRR